MLKRLLCFVFLTVFCFGNVAYGISDEAMVKKLQSTLRRELNDWIHETVSQECRQAGLRVPREITINVHGLNYKMGSLSLSFSSYVPEEAVKKMAKYVGVMAVDILKKNGRCPDGLFIAVIPFFDNGIYDAQTVTYEKDYVYYNTIPKDKVMAIINNAIK